MPEKNDEDIAPKIMIIKKRVARRQIFRRNRDPIVDQCEELVLMIVELFRLIDRD